MAKKENVILDLDQTLIYSHPAEKKLTPEQQAKAKKFKYYEMKDTNNKVIYITFERPGLQPFLDYLFSTYNVSVWTAATKDYALYIINNSILKKPGRKLSWILFDYHCDLSQQDTKYTKSLRMLWEKKKFNIPGHTEENTIIIDDLDEVYAAQPQNCIPIPVFKFSRAESQDDKNLSEIEKILKTYDPILKAVDEYVPPKKTS